MTQATLTETRAARFELEVSIHAPRQRVWDSLIREPNEWWPADFHCAGPDSVVSIQAEPGGKFLEKTKTGGLLWGTVIFVDAPNKITFQGTLSPEWGGPATSVVTFALEERGKKTIVQVTDAQFGLVSDGQIESLASGWKRLIGEALKAHAEKQ